MPAVQARVHGAISIVNAVATGRGATMGISLSAGALVETAPGAGVALETGGVAFSRRLVEATVRKIVSARTLADTRIRVNLESEIPAGRGLKSSSAISSAVALACARLFRPGLDDREVLLAGVEASIESGVSITGAYDDACGCYLGGFAVTDNAKRELVLHRKAPPDAVAVIFVPRRARRRNPKRLRERRGILNAAWVMARGSDYWNAMTLNGIAAGPLLGSDPSLISRLLEAGALGASVSGNGPAVAAVTRRGCVRAVKKIFSQLEGRTIVSTANNSRAEVHEV